MGRTESKCVSALPAYSGRFRMFWAMNFSVYFERFMYEPSLVGSESRNMSCSVRTNEKWLYTSLSWIPLGAFGWLVRMPNTLLPWPLLPRLYFEFDVSGEKVPSGFWASGLLVTA